MVTTSHRAHRVAIIEIVSAAILWGFSGVAAQKLFEGGNISPAWLAAVRVIGSGIILGAWRFGNLRRADVRGFLSDRKQLLALFAFAIFALDGVQLTFFLAIDHGNAITATLLQFTSPLLIVAWVALSSSKLPPIRQVGLALLAVMGVAMVVTRGSFGHLAMPLAGLLWGVITATLTALYNVMPRQLLRNHSPDSVVASSFLIGAIVLFPWLLLDMPTRIDPAQLMLVAFVIVGGTAIPFLLYIVSLATIEPLVANVIGTLEPIAVAIVSVIALGTRFTWGLGIGLVLVLASVVLISS